MSDDEFMRELRRSMKRKMCRHEIAIASRDTTGPIVYPYCWHRPIKRVKYLRLVRRLSHG